jgi:hypothetical protein
LSIDIRPGTADITSSPEETIRSETLSLKDRFIDPKGKIVGYAKAGELPIPIAAWTGVDGDYLSATIPAKRGYISFSLTKVDYSDPTCYTGFMKHILDSARVPNR